MSNLGLCFGRTLTMRKQGRLKPAECVCHNGRSPQMGEASGVCMRSVHAHCGSMMSVAGSSVHGLESLGAEAQKDNIIMLAP